MCLLKYQKLRIQTDKVCLELRVEVFDLCPHAQTDPFERSYKAGRLLGEAAAKNMPHSLTDNLEIRAKTESIAHHMVELVLRVVAQ